MADTLAAWRKAGTYAVELPSGFVANVRLPDLGMMLANGGFPNELRAEVMAAEEGNGTLTPEQTAKMAEFNAKVVAATVVSPALKPEDVDALPIEDRDAIVAIATRQIDPKSMAPKA